MMVPNCPKCNGKVKEIDSTIQSGHSRVNLKDGITRMNKITKSVYRCKDCDHEFTQ